MPHQSFIELHGDVMKHEMFSMWTLEDLAGVKSSNAQSLLIGALRHIGRA